jgi:hypothetical protein
VNERGVYHLGGHDSEQDPEHVSQTVKCARVCHHQPQRDSSQRGDQEYEPRFEPASIAPNAYSHSEIKKIHHQRFRSAQQPARRTVTPTFKPHARKRREESNDSGTWNKLQNVGSACKPHVAVDV